MTVASMNEQKCTSAIVIVVVLYNTGIAESETLSSLYVDEKLRERVRLLIWDNSPNPIADVDAEEALRRRIREVKFRHAPSNPGLATAYNAAIEYANEAFPDQQATWLLTFDQDTTIPLDYLGNILREVRHTNSDSVVAISPRVVEHDRQFSPVRTFCGLPWPGANIVSSGIQTKPITAINSGLCVRVSFLKAIGGYNHDFPLDYLDHWLCRTIYERNKAISVLDLKVNHRLSLNDFETRMGIGRYSSVLRAQRRFALTSKNLLTRVVLSLVLIPHGMKRFFGTKDKRYFKIAFREWIALIFGKTE